MAALAEAGVDVVGENRAQDLERKHAAYGDAFRWTSAACNRTGQRRQRHRELVPLPSDSAARRLTIPALLGEPVGETTKTGIQPEEIGSPSTPSYEADDDAAARRGRRSPPRATFHRLRELRRRTLLTDEHGHAGLQWLRRRRDLREGGEASSAAVRVSWRIGNSRSTI
jgi:hypothetical protein